MSVHPQGARPRSWYGPEDYVDGDDPDQESTDRRVKQEHWDSLYVELPWWKRWLSVLVGEVTEPVHSYQAPALVPAVYEENHFTRHTPGPWNVFLSDDGGQWTGWPLSISAANDEDKNIVRPGGHYPYTWDATMSEAEAVANAYLMAAAPDMLKAILASLPALEAAANAGNTSARAAAILSRSALELAKPKDLELA